MEQKINIAELLKDCPEGMELDCPMYENIYFDYISNAKIYPICCYTEDNLKVKYPITFTWCGRPSQHDSAKCVIFPKGKTTWEGFHKPFEDGDIVAFDGPHLQIYIFKNKKENNTLSDCYLMLDVDDDELYLEDGMYYVTRFATEEEKQKLFDAIKAKGYKWNPETKTLEKLIEPKFKAGDKVKRKDADYTYIVTIAKLDDDYYDYVNEDGQCGVIHISTQNDWELVPNKFDVTTLKPFESKVLVRDTVKEIWKPDFFGCLCDGDYCPYMVVGGIRWKYCIPYEGNEHLLGTTNDCDDYFKTW